MISEASPYLVLIPKVDGAIMKSASSLYSNLCILKDVKALLSERSAFQGDRLSWIHPLAHANSSPTAKLA
jgi:hypothetical protein